MTLAQQLIDSQRDAAGGAALFRQVFARLNCAPIVHARGLAARELENFAVTLPPYARWTSFEARHLSLNYVRREFLWYLRGDPRDLEIIRWARLWHDVANSDGSVNSNYGYQWFGKGGIDWVVTELTRDPDSRRAVVPILTLDHLHSTSRDIPCTYATAFRIRSGALNLSVHMRSQDVVFGFGNDVPAFSLLQELVAATLGVTVGTYHHAVDSLHLYERHWQMAHDIASGSPWLDVDASVPRVSGYAEARWILNECGYLSQHSDIFTKVPAEWKLAHWLIDVLTVTPPY